MRDSIGGAWLYGLVLTFVLLFISFLTVTVNYTKAYRVKNEVIDFIEREEGLTNRPATANAGEWGAVQLINNYLASNAQHARGGCPANEGWLGVETLTPQSAATSQPQPVRQGARYFYCVKKVNNYDPVLPHKAYYEVIMFFAFDLPVFGNITDFRVVGQTTQIAYPADCQVFRNQLGRC